MVALTITTTAVVPVSTADNTYINGVTNAAITIGQSCYLDTSTGLIGLFDADSATVAVHTMLGVAVSTATASGQNIVVQTGGQLAFGAILTKSLMYIGGGTTPGSINPSADASSGWYQHSLGYATTTSILVLRVHNSGVAF